jgi:selenide,water dikinase
VGPGDLRVIMAGLPRPVDPAVVVGTETSDDAGVYRLSDETAIVCTADFITPVIDDPYLFGQVAAANALSDVYAMGGRPLTAIALCMFPKALEPEAARGILAGGQDKVVEAGGAVVGGHTVRGEELLYGLSVTGVVDPRRVVRNVGLRPGDALILTKPLGSGLLINGRRKGALTDEELRPVLAVLATLNRAACEVMLRHFAAVHAATDVTGFGLVGHALEMALGSRVGLRIELASLPLYPHVGRMVEAGVTTGSTRPNREAGAPYLRGALGKVWDELVHDPQTSGGLLIGVAADDAAALLADLHATGVTHATRIGTAIDSPEPILELT